MMNAIRSIFVFTLLFSFSVSASTQELVRFDDENTKQRYENLLGELRCLVCQNQSLADSDAGLARDLRNELDLMLRQGNSDREIIEFMTDRYGDFVLYNPPLKASTLLLWIGPFLLLLLCMLMAFSYFVRRAPTKPESVIDEATRLHASKLLNDFDEDDSPC